MIDAYRDGSLADHWKRARSTEGTSRAERATLAVLEDQPV